MRGSWSLDLGGKVYKIFGLNGHFYLVRVIIITLFPSKNFYYNPNLSVITLNIKLFCCKNHRSSHWRCSVKEGVLKNFACNFIKKRLQGRCFLAKLAKVLRTSIFKNICERLLLQDITEKTIHLFLFIYFFHKIRTS